MLRAIAVGDTVCVHSFKGDRGARYRVGWPGYVHDIDYGKYYVSQYDPLSRASKFWMDPAEVGPTLQTFEGLFCLMCRKRVR